MRASQGYFTRLARNRNRVRFGSKFGQIQVLPTARVAVYAPRSFESADADDAGSARDLRGGVGRRIIHDIMAVRIRLKRIGTTNAPSYRIVVADGRSPRDGRFIEEIGSYLPQKRENDVTLALERAEYWLSKGARPTETVASFIKRARKSAPAPQG